MRRFFMSLLLLLMLPALAFAQNRGLLSNEYASWITATLSQTTISLPSGITSRDIFIRNGDASNMICVDLVGETIPESCVTNTSTDGGNPSIIVIEALGSIDLQDYSTSAIGIKTFGPSASPITVITTF